MTYLPGHPYAIDEDGTTTCPECDGEAFVGDGIAPRSCPVCDGQGWLTIDELRYLMREGI